MCHLSQHACVRMCLLSVFSFLALLEAIINTEGESRWLSRRYQLFKKNSRRIFELGSKMESINAIFSYSLTTAVPSQLLKLLLKIIN